MLGIEIGANLNAQGFADGMKQIQRSLSKFGTETISKYFGFDALKSLFGKVSDALDGLLEKRKEIKIGTAETGLDAQTFQLVNNGLKATEASAETLARAFEHVAEQMQKVKEGGEEGIKAAKAFATFGVSVEDVGKKSRQAITFQLMDGLRAAAQEGRVTEEQITALKDTLGKGAVQLLPFIARGQGKLADQFGIKSPEELKELDEFAQKTGERKAGWQAGMDKIAVAWGGALNFLADMGDAIKVSAQRALGDKGAQFKGDIRKEVDEREKLNNQVQENLMRSRIAEAKRAADVAAEEQAAQDQREKIAQFEFKRDEAREKMLSPEERSQHLNQSISDIRGRLGSEGDPVKRAQMEATIAEYELERQGLMRKTGATFHQGINELQKVGAASLNERTDPQVTELKKLIQVQMNQLAVLKAIDYDIKKGDQAFA